MYRKICCIGMACLLMLIVLSSVCMAGKLVNASGASNRDWKEGRIHADNPDRYERHIENEMKAMGEYEVNMSKIASMLIALANENIEYDNKYLYNFVEGKLGDSLVKYDYSDAIKNIKFDRIQFCQPIPEINSLPIKNKEIIKMFKQEEKNRDQQKLEAHADGMRITLIELYNIINNPNKEADNSIDRVIEIDYALDQLVSPYWEGIEKNGVVSNNQETYADPIGAKLSPKQHACLSFAAKVYIVNKKIKPTIGLGLTDSGIEKRISIFREAQNYISSPDFLPDISVFSEEEKTKIIRVQSIMKELCASNIEVVQDYKNTQETSKYISNSLLNLAYTMSTLKEAERKGAHVERLSEELDSILREIKYWE